MKLHRPAETGTGVLALIAAVLTGTLGWDPAIAALLIAVVGLAPTAITAAVLAGWLPRRGPFEEPRG